MKNNTSSPPHNSFPITRQAFDKYPITPQSELADISVARHLTYAINVLEHQNLEAGEVAALGLLGQIFLRVIKCYQEQKVTHLPHLVEEWLHANSGTEKVESTLLFKLDHFPPSAIYEEKRLSQDYLHSTTGDIPNKHLLYPSLILLMLSVENPAFDAVEMLLRDPELETKTAFPEITSRLDDFFQTQPTFGPQNQTLLEMLRAPIKANPHSITGQLEYIRLHWGNLIGGEFLARLLRNLDIIHEEEKLGLVGPGPVQAPDFTAITHEERHFSPDSNWMPKVILMAKNAYVWLDQLSKQYSHEIAHLDQIPDKELAKLASWGFTALWLIGLWERSSASQRIKQMCGNPDAVSSAYSLYDYIIANDLGGEDAYQNLRHRAEQHGLQMAADMVPNHVGIYSKWVIEHPNWFLSLNEKPYPSYSFQGANLSEDERVGIYLEDHYYDKTDASVVFKRVDFYTGDTKYIYHGNDGTAMPWNDTAQLDYLIPEVREAVIQTILHVARKAPIIRFDAAMTLAKRHFQRLWFPQPGTGGAIPTRAESGISKAAFDHVFPKEFWREVVDRVAMETPNTLLLAEAFWMMEGYFVRTLGMHRVYNSAFMNMLRDEDNAKYRDLIHKTLEFDPQILKRYVNFMNNPDEDTTISQFGKDGKYFGICTLMATLPGLPMFGHGQIEGFSEKYGMEYKRAYYDETPDQGLIARHEQLIFPLLHKRYLFAEVDNFVLYEFSSGDGSYPDVFAYSNRVGSERGFVIYHNKWGDVRGCVRDSVVVNGASQTLGEGLGLENHPGTFTIFRDAVSGLEYIRPTRNLFEKGLYFELDAYKTHVFLDFRQMEGSEYAQLNERLNMRGIPSLEASIREIKLEPVLAAFHQFASLENFHLIFPKMLSGDLKDEKLPEQTLTLKPSNSEQLHIVNVTALAFFKEALKTCLGISQTGREKIAPILANDSLQTLITLPGLAHYQGLEKEDITSDIQLQYYLLILWSIIRALDKEDFRPVCSDLNKTLITQVLTSFWGLSPGKIHQCFLAVKVMLQHQNWLQDSALTAGETLESLLSDPDVREYLNIHTHGGITWFQQEAFETLLFVMESIAFTNLELDTTLTEKERQVRKFDCQKLIARMDEAKEDSEYKMEELRKNIET